MKGTYVQRCDRCKRVLVDWHIPGSQRAGGNCTKCGDDLCIECAVSFNDDGECAKCAKEPTK